MIKFYTSLQRVHI